MTFILANQRDDPTSFERYRAYLERNRSRFSRGAYELACSSWYYDFRDHRCPHDGWLESLVIRERTNAAAEGERSVSIEVKLLGAYHDGYIVFTYPEVFSYDFGLHDGQGGHRDWRYDEFRLSDGGHLIHEVEWSGVSETGRWLIEASDIAYQWRDLKVGAAT